MKPARLAWLPMLLALPCTAFAESNKANFTPVDLVTYYEDANGLTGVELKSALNEIVVDHRTYSYTPCVSEILEETDEDPIKLDNFIALYTDRPIPKPVWCGGRNAPEALNREHEWAKSKGSPGKLQHTHTDAHYLRGVDEPENGDRGNRNRTDGGVQNGRGTECLEDGGTWEVPDGVEGDVLRMMFYVVVRDEGNDQSNAPALGLVGEIGADNGRRFGKHCTLFEWQRTDAVSDAERSRIVIVYTWEVNRDLCVDRPEFAAAICEPVYRESGERLNLEAPLCKRIKRLQAKLGNLGRLVHG